jgi:small GTP-binding protein
MSENHIRVAVVGNVDAGKSSLIGTLTTGQLDNGNGSSRRLITVHKHELESGRTSTISTHLLGYSNLEPIATHDSSGKHVVCTTANVAEKAETLVTLVDLAGHEKYLKTTIQGFSSGMIDYALVLVNSRHPPNHMTRQHINIAVACGIPIIVVLTKTDGCSTHVMKSTKEELFMLLRSPEIKKKPFQIRQESDVNLVLNKLHAITPVVSTSCVTGDGLDVLNLLLSSLPKRRRHQQKVGRAFEYLVEDIFNITGIGLVVSGFVNAGRATVGQKVHVGPFADGSFVETQIKSIQVARKDVKSIMAGNTACSALTLNKDQKRLIRKGMVVLQEPPDEISSQFEAEILALKGKGVDGTTIKKNYETMVHVLHIKQVAVIENVTRVAFDSFGEQMDNGEDTIRPGSKARIQFRFKKQKEYIRKGMRILFRDGHLRGCGIITKVGGWEANGDRME